MGETSARSRFPAVGVARFLIAVSACVAIWTVAVLPARHFEDHRNLQYRQVFYENIAFVPILTVFGAVALLTIHKALGARWPQLLVAVTVIVLQAWLVSRAVMNMSFGRGP